MQYAYTDAELERLYPRQKGYTLQRYKGLGEMNPQQLWETTMDPMRRSLIRGDRGRGRGRAAVIVLMGDQVEKRKQYIADHADFNRQDTFAAKEGRDGD